ncbi:alpha/beta hydrolase [Paracrocinitomix mangrovi]|uniref:alpha/beta fold hydrolase n=1 Tax=Paracrocinitomix mangrovi TaxID=2862509 RepID=UPI001C8ED15C|nr:alpha/beta hydrolase [Paracrocinitomix mangrovi]UKN02143.1 alpha/beta hydrolase [Paracrocinitomix mangrovi]
MNKKFSRKGLTENFFENDQHKIHFYEGGEGPTFLIIHGFGADAQITWSQSLYDLMDDHHVIAPDLLWFGKSSSKAKAELDSQVDALFDLLESRKVDKCKIMGISYGGFVSLGMIYKKPDMFEKVVIVDSPGVTYNVNLLDTLCNQQGVAEVTDIFVPTNGDEVNRLLNLGSYKDRKLPKKVKMDTYLFYFDQHHEELKSLLTSLPKEQAKFRENTEINFPPSMVIWGDTDEVFPLSEGQKLAEFMGAKFVTVPKAGHAVNLDNFKGFQKELRVFLSEK